MASSSPSSSEVADLNVVVVGSTREAQHDLIEKWASGGEMRILSKDEDEPIRVQQDYMNGDYCLVFHLITGPPSGDLVSLLLRDANVVVFVFDNNQPFRVNNVLYDDWVPKVQECVSKDAGLFLVEIHPRGPGESENDCTEAYHINLLFETMGCDPDFFIRFCNEDALERYAQFTKQLFQVAEVGQKIRKELRADQDSNSDTTAIG